MKKKIFSLLALVMVAMTASADADPTYSLTKADGAEAHGTITFKVGGNTVTAAPEGATVTVVIEPDDGWAVGQPTGEWGAAIAKAPRRTSIDMLGSFELTKLLGADNTWSFVMQRANAEISCTYKKLLTNPDITITVADATYTGSALKPAVTVKDGETTLVKGTDYTVVYSNNVIARPADATENAPTVTITGIGDNYAGTTSKTFTIKPKVIEEGGIEYTVGGDYFGVTIDETGDLQIETLPEDLEVDTLNYMRHIDEGEDVYTTCLPSNPPTASYLKYYTLTGVNGSTLQFDEIAGAPEAYMPYLVVTDKSTTLSIGNVTNVTLVKTVANEASAGNYVLKGTFSGIQHDDAIGLYILQPGNRWGKVGSNTNAYIPPFRAYIEATSAGAPNQLSSDFGGTTGIKNIRTVDRDGTERWFDLNGRRIENPTTKGVYIQNGKTVVVK